MQAQSLATLSKEELREKLLQPDEITGSEILLRSLLLEGVECVFGYPGGAVLYIYDAMHGNPDFNHLLTRHEQGAIHAADGYARSTGKVGVCIATSGPGATNLVTGIATAYMDSVPLVVITGNVATTGNRDGCLSGSGHHRDYHADYQAQLSRAGCPGSCRNYS